MDINKEILKYSDMIYHVIHYKLSKIPDVITIDDLFAVGQKIVWETFTSFDETKTISKKSYTYAILRYRLIDYVRTLTGDRQDRPSKKNQAIHYNIDEYKELRDSVCVENAVINKIDGDILLNEMQKLDNKKRYIIENYMQGLSLVDIAKTIGISDSRACQLKGEGLKELREIIEFKSVA